MKKLKEHVPFLIREIDKLCSQSMWLQPQNVLLVIAGLSPAKEEADVACEHFCQTLEWLPMSADAKVDVICRLLCMCWYCKDERPDDADDGVSGDAVLRSFLCDYWYDTGRCDWVLEGLLGIDSLRSTLLAVED